ncbi:Protein TAR1 [Abeliophyllum distichum]|uniref:Protein TAR1 n=1 Tax=Abeliophyllum distichum TaxID=126358 RepID=A0ABD1NR42_9LAMI
MRAHGRPISNPTPPRIPFGRRWRATRCVTPRQTCPQHNGFGRNLRSKTRWFTGFCNSHQVSHFAAFFIDARAEISVAESRFKLETRLVPRSTPRTGHPRTGSVVEYSLARFAPGFVSPNDECSNCTRRRSGIPTRDNTGAEPASSSRVFDNMFAGLPCRFSGLLATSRAANCPRRRDPNTSPDHSIGRSDGRCVQRAGT